jgi:hypothetical protein
LALTSDCKKAALPIRPEEDSTLSRGIQPCQAYRLAEELQTSPECEGIFAVGTSFAEVVGALADLEPSQFLNGFGEQAAETATEYPGRFGGTVTGTVKGEFEATHLAVVAHTFPGVGIFVRPNHWFGSTDAHFNSLLMHEGAHLLHKPSIRDLSDSKLLNQLGITSKNTNEITAGIRKECFEPKK